LLSVRVLTPDGDPIANATLDIWQADSDGEYSLTSYSLRGKATTDANGHVEILTVPPGMYGPQFAKRAGHIHVIIRPPKGKADKYDELTTQIYICKGNDSKWMQGDLCVPISRHLLFCCD
jgi:protocatechuate 3,4-dioxygenase beta subunit